MTPTQLAAIVGPIVLLATLAARGALALARINQRIDSAERRLAEHDSDLHDLGTALNPPSHHGESHVEDPR